MTSFAQGYSEQQLESLLDSVSTNPDYVIQWADRAIAQNVNCSDAYFVKAVVFTAEEDYFQTLEFLNKSLEVVSSKSIITKSEILCFRGMIYSIVEDYDLALVDYNEAIRLNPKEVDAYEYRAALYEKMLQYDKAETDYRTLLKLKDSLAYKLELVSVLAYQNKTDEALEILNKTIKYQPKQVLPYASRAWVHALREEGQAAIADYIRFMELDGDYSLDYLVALSTMDYVYTITLLSQQIINDSENLIWLAARIRVHIAEGEYDFALSDLNTFESAQGESTPFSLYQKSKCYKGLYEFNDEVNALTLLIEELDESDVDVYVARGVALRNVGRLEEALQNFDTALQISPISYYAYMERGWTYEMQNNFDQAIKDYNAAITFNPNNAWIYVQRGKILQEKGDSIKAKADFEMAMQLDTVSNSYAFALLGVGRLQEAIEFLQNTVMQDVTNAANQYDLACLYALANKKQEALISLNKAIELGYKNYNHIKLDRDLTNIREEEGYNDIIDSITQMKISKMFDEFSR